MTSFKVEMIKRLASGGTLTAKEVAARAGVTADQVYYHTKKAGLTLATPWKEWDYPAIQLFYDQGHTTRQTMEHFGMTGDQMRYARRRGLLDMPPISNGRPAVDASEDEQAHRLFEIWRASRAA